MVTPLVLRVHHALGVLQARLLEEAQDGTLGLHNARHHRLTVEHTRGHWYAVSPPRALDIPEHCHPGVRGGAPSRLRRWTSAPLPDPDHWKEGGSPAPGAGGWQDGPSPRGAPFELGAVGLDPTDAAADPTAPPLDVLVPVPPVEAAAADPSPHAVPPTATLLALPQDGHSRASQEFWTLPGPMRQAPVGLLA